MGCAYSYSKSMPPESAVSQHPVDSAFAKCPASIVNGRRIEQSREREAMLSRPYATSVRKLPYATDMAMSPKVSPPIPAHPSQGSSDTLSCSTTGRRAELPPPTSESGEESPVFALPDGERDAYSAPGGPLTMNSAVSFAGCAEPKTCDRPGR